MSTHSEPPRGERALIRRIALELADRTAAGAVPFGDDAAGLPVGSPAWVWTTDLLTAGTDFDPGRHAWRQIGRKAMAVNLSDCAAMGCAPRVALCGLVLSDDLTQDDALEIVRGVRACGDEFGCALVGGDTNSWPHPTVIAVTVAAQCEPGLRPVLRSGARPGDVVYVSGALGGSILGRHMTFVPRVELGLELNRRFAPHAMIDVSDGLSVDLRQVLEASGCAAELDRGLLECAIHEDARRLSAQDGQPALHHALHDGEDFELLVVLDAATPAEELTQLGLLPLGRITSGPPRLLVSGGGQATEEIEPRGWEHFRG
jgi:thiamine-monophosphate kinase